MGIKDRSGPVRDVDFRRDWLAKRRRCDYCGVTRAATMFVRWPHGLVAHHLIRGTRSDEACNLQGPCSRCHDLIHGARIRIDPDEAERLGIEGLYWPNISFPEQLAVKRARDPGEWDRERLEHLWHRHLPDLPDVPDWVASAYPV